jgi:hypothetical protein
MGDRAKNLRPVLAGAVSNSIHEYFKQQFISEGAEGGTAWAPLTQATKAAKGSRSGMGTLRFSNRMWASLTKRSSPDQFKRVTNDSLEQGTVDPKAIFHQEGFTVTQVHGRSINPVVVEPRELVPETMPQKWVDEWDSLVLKYIEGGVDT